MADDPTMPRVSRSNRPVRKTFKKELGNLAKMENNEALGSRRPMRKRGGRRPLSSRSWRSDGGPVTRRHRKMPPSRKKKLKKSTPTGAKNLVKSSPSRAPLVKSERIMRVGRTPRECYAPSASSDRLGGNGAEDAAAYLTALRQHLRRFAELVERARPSDHPLLLNVLMCSAGSLLCLAREVLAADGPTTEELCQTILDRVDYFVSVLGRPSTS